MSVRRLAIRQPEEFALSAKAKREISKWVKKYPGDRQRSALIPALWIAQKDAGGWLPEKALRELGDMLDMAYIRVYEVATFYTMFNLVPVGTHLIQMCGTTPCWLRGSDGLKEVLERRIGPKGSTSKDGKFSWMEVECLGSCANAPMAQISNQKGDEYYEDLTPETLEALMDNLAAGKKVKAGPQNTRHTSEPEGGAMVLNTKNLSKARGTLKKLPNADKKAKVNYYEWDPKERRATRGGWVDPKLKANRDPKKRADNLGKDLTGGIPDEKPKAAKPKRATKPAVKKAAVKKKPVAKKTPAKKQAAKKPKVLYTDGPTDGPKDDLKKISGVGPKFERELNTNGVYYFRQVGAWKVADVKTVEDKIKSLASGRVKRDEWVKQAKALANKAKS